MILNSNSPSWVHTAVFSLPAGCIATCQYSLNKLSVVKMHESVKVSSVSSIRGIGYASFLVTPLSCTLLSSLH